MKYIFKPEKELAFCRFYGGIAFSPEEVTEIKKLGDSITQNDAVTYGGNSPVRQGSTAWIPQNGETSWIYEKLVTMVKDANNELWNFELTGFLEDLQYTTYNGKGKKKGDHYGAHLDFDGNCTRKISIVVQLTEPEEYEGGELEIYTWDRPFVADKTIGSCVLFPSFLLHKVTPVTKGKRNSLVLWVSGHPFR
jgi:PKHD-type hydroxylase|tara:strand:+ start:131 stop:709 length:579 start_codon:yes stop_codon:yes gene_type:complete